VCTSDSAPLSPSDAMFDRIKMHRKKTVWKPENRHKSDWIWMKIFIFNRLSISKFFLLFPPLAYLMIGHNEIVKWPMRSGWWTWCLLWIVLAVAEFQMARTISRLFLSGQRLHLEPISSNYKPLGHSSANGSPRAPTAHFGLRRNRLCRDFYLRWGYVVLGNAKITQKIDCDYFVGYFVPNYALDHQQAEV
jgi:hypothetical protein